MLCQGRLCHQLSACQRWVLLFQSTDQLTFLLSLLHLPHNTPGKRGNKAEVGRRCSLCLCSFIPSFLFPVEAWMQNEEKTAPYFNLVLHVICPIKHWCSFNKTEPMRLLNTLRLGFLVTLSLLPESDGQRELHV